MNLDLFLVCGVILSGDTGQGQGQPLQPHHHKGKQPIRLQPFYAEISILDFSLSVQDSKKKKKITGDIQHFLIN